MIYETLYNLLVPLISSGVLTAEQELVVTLCCFIGTIFIIAVPFILVFLFLKVLVRIIR